MTVVRANFLPEFDFGDNAVLLTMDGIGVAAVLVTLREAIEKGISQIDIGDVTHDFRISDGRADVHLEPHHVTWQFDRAKSDEVATGLTVLHDSGSAGHIYVDMQHPAPTLVLSRDEYVHVIYPWIDPAAPHPHLRQ